LILLPVLLLAAASPAPLSPADVSRLQSARNVGLAALEEGDLAEASKRFEVVRKLAPADPLGWADGGVAAMRAKDLAASKKLLDGALARAPADARVLALVALHAELSGDAPGAISLYEKAAAAAPSDLPSRWAAGKDPDRSTRLRCGERGAHHPFLDPLRLGLAASREPGLPTGRPAQSAIWSEPITKASG